MKSTRNIKLLIIVLLVVQCISCSIRETKIEYYDSGEIKAIYKTKNNIKDGPFKVFFPNGSIQIKGFYNGGKLHGLWRSYFQNGNLEVECNWTHGVIDGVLTRYYSSGNIYVEVELQNGVKFGKRITYYENGKIASQGVHTGIMDTDSINFYDENGVLNTTSFYFLEEQIWKQIEYAESKTYYFPYFYDLKDTLSLHSLYNLNVCLGMSFDFDVLQVMIGELNGDNFFVKDTFNSTNSSNCLTFTISCDKLGANTMNGYVKYSRAKEVLHYYVPFTLNYFVLPPQSHAGQEKAEGGL
jgi:antitoxin component YwqK of YwqJK toxin-antitoxin module